jgi:UDP-2,3-diacylglucosamine hydrolase
MSDQKKIYFLSDFHLGAPDAQSSLDREKKIIRFLDQIKNNSERIFILGDMFDFWFEYKKVVPKGYVRILGKLAELTDNGIPIDFFVGNHDMWMKDYFQKELNIPVHFEPKAFRLHEKNVLIGHGDGLGPGDHGYKFLKKLFRNSIAQFLFGSLPPSIGIGLADYFSRKSRAKTGQSDEVFESEEKEWLVHYCREMLKTKQFDFFVFGHRHLPLQIQLNEKSTYVNLGDWIKYDTYAMMDDSGLHLKYHKS